MLWVNELTAKNLNNIACAKYYSKKINFNAAYWIVKTKRMALK